MFSPEAKNRDPDNAKGVRRDSVGYLAPNLNLYIINLSLKKYLMWYKRGLCYLKQKSKAEA